MAPNCRPNGLHERKPSMLTFSRSLKTNMIGVSTLISSKKSTTTGLCLRSTCLPVDAQLNSIDSDRGFGIRAAPSSMHIQNHGSQNWAGSAHQSNLLVGRCIRKMQKDKAKGSLLVPLWFSAPWCPCSLNLSFSCLSPATGFCNANLTCSKKVYANGICFLLTRPTAMWSSYTSATVAYIITCTSGRPDTCVTLHKGRGRDAAARRLDRADGCGRAWGPAHWNINFHSCKCRWQDAAPRWLSQ